MTRERYDPDDAREWLNRARSTLHWACQSAPEIYLEELYFGAQQAAEKAIKGVFVHLREPFPYTHDLDRLLMLLSQKRIDVPDSVRRARELSVFALELRYHSVGKETTEEQYRKALAIAEAVVRWAEEIILAGGRQPG
jgi:HEPN domain-containing protein